MVTKSVVVLICLGYIAGCSTYLVQTAGAETAPVKQQAAVHDDPPSADIGPVSPQAKEQAARLDTLPPVTRRAGTDLSGRKQVGKASYYAPKFDGRKMADGHKFEPTANVAASKTLPLGTTAKVTNEATGKSAIVTVQDRGPYVDGRIIDVSPKVARQLDMTHKGVSKVVVKPIAEPKPDGGVKLGAGAAETPTPALQQAVKTTQSFAGSQ
ncbi:MAG: septal ring lytic transglycosylase RlpA family protein [Acetobacteraceae bacterium]|nr:septal ring lytic transglycosylase RlpA family protein [Acetobacteraceae bacterium]